ncbi:MAG: FAD-dependent monooxygenase [Pseudomonadota bacterium]
MRSSATVLVVGASTTGLTMACQLLRYGIPVRLVDKNTQINPIVRAIGVHARSLEIFDDLGIGEAFHDEGLIINGRNIFVDGNLALHSVWPDVNRPHPHDIAIGQNRTEAHLGDCLHRLGGTVERQVELIDLDQTMAGVRATLRHADGTTETMGTPYLIGCDGAHSAVRQLNRLHFTGNADPRSFMIADVILDGDLPRNAISMAVNKVGFSFYTPIPNGRYQVAAEWPDAPPDDTPPTLEAVQDMLDKRAPWPTKASDPEWLGHFRIDYRVAPSYRHGRSFLVGDAAHVHGPVGGRGMNCGIQDAYNLGFKLALVLRGEAPGALLDTYERERQPVAEANVRWSQSTSGKLMEYQAMPDEARTDFFMAVTTPKEPDVVIRQALEAAELAIAYPRSFITKEDVEDRQRRNLFLSGPAPGTSAIRALNIVVDGDPMTFAAYLAGIKFTVLGFAGINGSAIETAELRSLLKGAADRLDDLAQVAITVTDMDQVGERDTDGISVLLDASGELHKIFGAHEAGLYVIRPDGHVGYRSQPPAMVPLRTYLDRVFCT